MSLGLPSALILGIDHFVAKKLAEELANKDIRVVGVGEFIPELSDLANFDWKESLEEVEGEFNYLFDFEADKQTWQTIKADKITLISVNNEVRNNYLAREVTGWEADWRVVDAREVYGERMDENSLVGKALARAVANKNLELPSPEQIIRLLSVSDLVEAILRACFLSGTEREYFLILGKEIKIEDMAKVLMDKAKMTRFKVMENSIKIDQGNEKLAEASESQLRWRAEIPFEEGVVKALQYFFSRVDQENRQRKKTKLIKNTTVVKQPGQRPFAVVVEEVEEKVEKEETEKPKEIKVEVSEPKMVVFDEGKTEEDFEIPKLIKIKEEEIEREKKEDYIEEESEDFVVIETEKSEEVLEIKNKPRIKKEVSKWWWAGLVGIIVLLLVWPLKWIWVTRLAVGVITKTPELIREKKYNQVEVMADAKIKELTSIDEKISEWGLNSLETVRNYQTGIKVLVDFLAMEKQSLNLFRVTDEMSEAVFGDKEISWGDQLEAINNGLVEVENNMGILQARLSGSSGWIPTRWRGMVQEGTKTMEELKVQLSLGREVLKIAPEILGVDGRVREYMILFQNESEIRPTGGFIGSYGLISFQKGKLIGFEVKDIYEADGQLKGHVEPPWEIKTHLGEANWYMRDANWNPDFVKTSADIQWFLEKEINKKVDGVVGINLAVVKAMLKVTGPIKVMDFKETIDENNLYEQAEFYAETKFFPGSGQKASFLGTLGKQLFEEIKNLRTEKKLLLYQSLIDLLESNEMQVAVNNLTAAGVLDELEWSGKIYKGKCASSDCVTDYWYAVEANVGVNKANYFIRKSIEEGVELLGESLNRVVKINYENTAKNNSWPGGDYKNYLRIYVPREVVLSQISVSDGYDATIKKVYSGDEIRIREVDGKKEIGFLVMVPVTKKRIVEIKYSSKIDLADKKEFTYMKYIQKQPGTGETGLVTLVSFGEEWQPLQVEPSASLVGGKLLFNQKLSRNIKMGVVLGR